MKIVFMGTPLFAVASFNALVNKHEITAVFTQPDRPAGRGFKLQASPVKTAALEHNIPVFTPETLRLPLAKEIRAQLREFNADIFIVAAYGLLLPKGVLSMPEHGCVNVHASLLPKYRGASPIHSALLNGDTETGITIMQMDSGIDTGDIILQKSLSVSPEERFTLLHDRMAQLGGEVLLEALEQIENNIAIRTPQDNLLSSYSPLIKKSDGEINPNETTKQILNKIRAFDPWPGCFTEFNGKKIKVWGAEKVSSNNTDGIILKTADGVLRVTEVQAEGKKRMPATDFLRGTTPV